MPKALQQAAQLIKKKDMWELQCRERLSISAVDLIARDREDRIQTLIRRTFYSLHRIDRDNSVSTHQRIDIRSAINMVG